MLATVLLISPVLAAQSLAPWMLFLTGNAIWLVDSLLRKDVPWITMSAFFVVYDILILLARIYGIDVLHYLVPLLNRLA